MLAKQHANLGVVGYIGASFGLAAIGHTGIAGPAVSASLESLIQPVNLAVLTTVAGAFALIPDLDHPGSTVSRKFGVLSQFVSRAFGALTGGHREASHSLLFSAICGVIGLLATLIPIRAAVNGVRLDSAVLFTALMLVLAIMFIFKLVVPLGLGRRYYNLAVLASLGLAAWAVLSGTLLVPGWALALAMFLGVNLHVLGDCCTPSGCKWLWPSQHEHHVRTPLGNALNGKTGQWRELNVTQPLLIIAASLLVVATILLPMGQEVGAHAHSWMAHATQWAEGLNR